MLDQLLNRPIVGSLRERDVDLLLCAELHAGSRLVSLFAEATKLYGASFVRAWVSHMEEDGESDLVVMLKHNEQDVLLLIENKINAPFTPTQVERYQKRASRWRNVTGISHVATIIVAPTLYLNRADAQGFDVLISYEDIAGRIESSDDPRSRFSAKVLLEGIEAAQRGYVAQPDKKATDIWSACWELSLRHAPNLNLSRPAAKPSRSTWFNFKDAKGFESPTNKHVSVFFKAERGRVDLQFSATTHAELASIAEGFIAPDMAVVNAAKSASIRLRVEPVDFTADPDSQQDALIQGLLASERLRVFFIDHRAQFMRISVLSCL